MCEATYIYFFQSACYSQKRGNHKNTWTTYGISGPYLVKDVERCPLKGTHGQYRMVNPIREFGSGEYNFGNLRNQRGLEYVFVFDVYNIVKHQYVLKNPYLGILYNIAAERNSFRSRAGDKEDYKEVFEKCFTEFDDDARNFDACIDYFDYINYPGGGDRQALCFPQNDGGFCVTGRLVQDTNVVQVPVTITYNDVTTGEHFLCKDPRNPELIQSECDKGSQMLYGTDCWPVDIDLFCERLSHYLVSMRENVVTQYTPYYYGIPYDETLKELQSEGYSDVDIAWTGVGATTPIFDNDDIAQIVGEANIIGIVTHTAVFGTMSDIQFPGGIIIRSTHPKIHTRIQRSLEDTSAALSDIECNVVRIRTPNIRFENVEFDNAGCQEVALNIAGAHVSEKDQLARAFRYFKGWNMAAVRLTKEFNETDPENITFINIKTTSAQRFRNKFPGKPLISVDNAMLQEKHTNVNNLYISNANDTFDYEIVTKANQAVPLAPLDMIMWNYKGNVSFGYFPENWEVVAYSPKESQNTTGDFYAEASNNVISFEECEPQKTRNEYYEKYVFGTMTIDNTSIISIFHPHIRDLLIFFYPENKLTAYKISSLGRNHPFVEIRELDPNATFRDFTDNPGKVWDASIGTQAKDPNFDFIAIVQESPDNTIIGKRTNDSYCKEYGGDDCQYMHQPYYRCMKDVREITETLQIIDGEAFFDIASDRFRCFDPIVVDCRTNEILEAVAIVMGGIILMVVTHALGSVYSAFKGIPDCLDIEIDISEVEEDIEKITDT